MSLRTTLPPARAAAAITELLDGPPEWWSFSSDEAAGHRLRGNIDGRRVRMVVMPKQWRSIAYLPVATGTLVSQAEGSVLTLAFRPRMPEIAFILAWCGLVVGSGGPIWFGVGVPCLYHVVGSLLCFPREVNRVVSLARWVLAGRVGVPRYEDGAAEQADAADEAQGGTRTAR